MDQKLFREDSKEKQYLLKVYPAKKSRVAWRKIEICGNDTLTDLCTIILDAFNFDHDHFYEFCMDNRPYSNNAYTIDRDADYPEINIVLDTMELYEKQKFSLHYDFGDDWMFTIDVVKIVSVENYFKPHVIGSKGKVKQY